jgi:hypothetical protein
MQNIVTGIPFYCLYKIINETDMERERERGRGNDSERVKKERVQEVRYKKGRKEEEHSE